MEYFFNHESPVRGEIFVTRKITRGLTRIFLGSQKILYLGNLDAKRDWGHAKDYVEMMWLMLQQKIPEDYVISTGVQYTVREFVNAVANKLGMKIEWRDHGEKEEGFWINSSNEKYNLSPIIRIDPRYFRPAEVDNLLGDSNNARKKLGWKPKTTFKELVAEMTEYDLKLSRQEYNIKNKSFSEQTSIN